MMTTPMQTTDLTEKIRTARRRLLQMHYEAGVGHIGGNLSCLDLLMTLYHEVLQPEDVFVLSKGHAAGALYVTLWSKGIISEEDLKSFHQDGTRLAGHPIPGSREEIPFAGGSLGHGLPFALGIAMGRKLRNAAGRVYCLMSDGEWQEGSNWEALSLMARERPNLTVIVDANGLQRFGTTEEIGGSEPLAKRLSAFRVCVSEVSGRNHKAFRSALIMNPVNPRIVLARTHKGEGVSFMQDRLEWHYLPMSEAQYHQVIWEIDERNTVTTIDRIG